MPNKGVVDKSQDWWVSKYSAVRAKHERFCAKLKELLQELLSKRSIKYQVVEARAKSAESFAEKLQRDGKSYADPLQEITDLSGLRIILYYLEDVDKVCGILDTEFRVDRSRSVDKRAVLAADQFGYLSVHKIVSLSSSRAKLPEWSSFRALVAEVQVRTVLQHAWAAISHALQYKRKADIPYQFRRKLLRVAGLLELADEEFSARRKEQAALEKKITERIVERELDIPIDLLALQRFIAKSRTAEKIEKTARDSGFGRSEVEAYSQLVFASEAVGINELDALEQELISLMPKAKTFFTKFLNSGHRDALGSRPHLLAILIIGAHREKFTRDILVSQLSWGAKYARDVLLTGQVFRNLK